MVSSPRSTVTTTRTPHSPRSRTDRARVPSLRYAKRRTNANRGTFVCVRRVPWYLSNASAVGESLDIADLRAAMYAAHPLEKLPPPERRKAIRVAAGVTVD